MDDLNHELEHVVWQIATTKAIISDQLTVIEALREAGGPFAFAEDTLRMMKVILELFQADERDLRSAIEQKYELLER
jgi:hypothetical protein